MRALYPLLALLGLALAGSATACGHGPRSSTAPGVADGADLAAGGLGGTLEATLWGTEWRLEDLAGAGALERVEATLAFPEMGRAAGSGSCNRFSGAVQISGDSISFGPLASTRMGCAEPISTQEVRYLGALQNAERFVLQGSSLLIHSRGLEKPLRFVRTGP